MSEMWRINILAHGIYIPFFSSLSLKIYLSYRWQTYGTRDDRQGTQMFCFFEEIKNCNSQNYY